MSQDRPTISICTIVKNEESQIRDFLDSLINFADEIVLVDTGSSDKTLQFINEYAALHKDLIRVFSFQEEGVFHYGVAKNFSIEKATKEYVLILDADERLSFDFKTEIKGFLKERNPLVASIVRRDEAVPHLIERHERIIKNGAHIFYDTDDAARLHEHLVHTYAIAEFAPLIVHCQRENHWLQTPQRILFQMRLEIERTPKTKSFMGHIVRGIWAFQYKFRKVYFDQNLYKDGRAGLKFAFMRGFYVFLVQVFVGLKPPKGYFYWKDTV